MPVSLANIFRNQEEQEEPVVAELTATIPNWVSGSYLRVGPGKFDIGDVTMTHFIDGYAMLSKFEIKDGQVTFHKKFLQSEAYKKASQAKKPIYPEFATKGNLESRGFFSRVINALSSAEITDNDPINLYTIEGQLFAASESCHVHNVDPTNLSTGDKIDYYKIFGVHMATAHPLKDNKGDLYNIGTSFTTGCKYQILKIPNIGSGNVKEAIKKASVFATIYPSWTTSFSYYHSFTMTDNYIVMIEQPLLMNVVKLAEAKMQGKGIRDIMKWTPTEKNRFHVVNKNTGEVLKIKYFSDVPFFFFHFVNSYEEGNQLVIDINANPNEKVFDKMLISRLREDNVGEHDLSQVQRFIIPLVDNVKELPKETNLVTVPYTTATAFRHGDSIVISSERIGPAGFEGPTLTPYKRFKKYKYIYGTGSCLPGFYANSICKMDVENGQVTLWRDKDYLFPGEPEFIPRPDSKDEDDGVLIASVSDARSDIGKDFMILIDAKNMTEITRALVPVQVPQFIHGVFVPTRKYSTH